MAAQSPAKEPESVEEEEETMEEEEEEEIMEEEFTVQIGATYSCKRSDGTYHDAEVVKTRMNKRAGREEYYVRYAGLNCRQNEWVDKTRLVLVKAEEEEEEDDEALNEEEEDAANEEDEAVDETNQETSENGNEPQKEEAEPEKEAEEEDEPQQEEEEDEEPQAKKIRVEVHEAPANSSVVASDDFAEELTCLLCNELFKDPVVVECGHNFCRNCIDEAWEGQESFTCPDCEEEITEKRYTSNRALANLVKKTAAGVSTPGTTPGKTIVKEKVPLPENCHVHEERLKLFCKDDGDLGCVICRESLKHANHNFLPILDAMGVYKTELSSMVTPLEEALKVAEQMAKQQNEKIDKHRTSMKEYRENIESEFVKLHNFLKEREEKLLGKLQTEGENLLSEMEENIAKIQENIDNIKESIATASEKMSDADSISFLTDIKTFIKKCQDQQKEALSPGNTVIEKELSAEDYKVPIQASMFDNLKTSATAVVQKPKEIWIIGNYWVTRAKKSAYGKNLGLDEKQFSVRWMDGYNLQWSHFFQELRRAASLYGKPNMVFIHLGSSDLGKDHLFKFIYNVKKDLTRLTSLHPNTHFIWSNVLPRKEWQKHMESQRNMFNEKVSSHALSCGFQVAELSEVADLCNDSFHLKNKGSALHKISDAFTEKLKDALETAFNKMKELP